MKINVFGVSTVEDDEQRVSRYLVWATGVTVAVALIWAGNFELDEITKAQGRVIPASREQVIQSLDSGVLNELLVREGDSVVAGQILLKIDDARSGPMFREARAKKVALAAQASRLRAEALSLPLEFPPEVMAQPELVKQERQAYMARRQALDQQVASVKNSLTANASSVKAVQASIAATGRELRDDAAARRPGCHFRS